MLVGALILGGVIAAALPIPPWLAYVLGVAGGLTVGLDSLPRTGTAGISATVLGLAAGVGLGLFHLAAISAHASRPWQGIAVRVAGSWIAASA